MSSLPELIYERIDRLPRVYISLSPKERVKGFLKTLEYSRDSRRNAIADVRVLSRLGKPFYVDQSMLLAPKGSFVIYKNVHVFKYGTETIFRARYISSLYTVSKAKVTQTIGEDKKVVTVIFPPRGYYDCDLPHRITRVGKETATAEILWRMRVDRQVKEYNFGLFDDRFKPVDEYPVAGADNAELTLSYDFSEANLVYPTPLPSGLRITNMSVRFASGFVLFQDKYYKDPQMNNTVEFSWTLVNDTSYPLTVKHWGLPISVLYEDSRHVSQVNADISVSDRSVPAGSSTRYTYSVNLPAWAYGHIALAHAVKVYRPGALLYGGGPLFQFDVFRLRLP